jgi:hypothetical protein
MKSKHIPVVAAIAVLVLILTVGLAWGAGETRMHRNMPANMQGMSSEQMQEFCQEMHDDMGSMMGGSQNGGGSMMGGSQNGGS